MKKYRVTLTDEERQRLQPTIAAGKALAHARVLLKADQADGSPAWPDHRIAELIDSDALGCIACMAMTSAMARATAIFLALSGVTSVPVSRISHTDHEHVPLFLRGCYSTFRATSVRVLSGGMPATPPG